MRVTELLEFVRIKPSGIQYDPWYAERGTAVHTACELYDKNDLDEKSLDTQIEPYLAGWKAFRSQCLGTISLIEYRMIVGELRGTMDRLMMFGEDAKVVDIKSGRPEKWHRWQVALYRYLAYHDSSTGCGAPPSGLCVYLNAKSRSYTTSWYNDPKDIDTAAAIIEYARVLQEFA